MNILDMRYLAPAQFPTNSVENRRWRWESIGKSYRRMGGERR